MVSFIYYTFIDFPMRNVYPDPMLTFSILVGYWALGADLSELFITLGINLYSEKYFSASSRF